MKSSRTGLLALALAPLGVAAACTAKDPMYFRPAPAAVESDPDSMAAPIVSTVQLPVRVEDGDEMEERLALAMQLGLMPDDVPLARRDHYAASIEWSIKNLSDQEGIATLAVVGASEFFKYDPAVFVIDPDEDEPPPPLLGGIPIVVPPLGVVTGVFREDQLDEASQDWDAVSRGGITPQYATLTLWPTDDVTGGMGGQLATIPGAAVAALIQYDVAFSADQRMVLEYQLRVRDRDDRLEPCTMEAIAQATCGATLVPPSTTVYTPPPPAMP
jgi:hypothetical protein